MPIYESYGVKRSNLTRQQRLEAEAALYGYDMNATEEQKPLTQEDIEKMRAIVSNHDREAGVKEFDLNKPVNGVVGPTGQVEPYRYLPFPKVLYNHEKRTTTVATSEEDMEKKAKDGFKKEPFPAEIPQREYDMILGADELPKGSVLDRDAAGKQDKPQQDNNKPKGK